MVIYCKSTMPDSGRGRLMSPRQNGKSSAPLLFCNWLNNLLQGYAVDAHGYKM